MTNKETIIESVSKALFETYIMCEISTQDMYDRYYKDKVPSDMFQFIANITGAEGGDKNPFTTCLMDLYSKLYTKAKDDERITRAFKIEAARFMKMYNSISAEDIKRQARERVKKCKKWSEFEELMDEIGQAYIDRDDFYTRRDAIYPIHESDIVTIFAPLTPEASKYNCDYTHWCTAKHDRDFYVHCGKDRWIVVIQFHDDNDPNTKDYQVEVGIDGDIKEIRDEENKEVTGDDTEMTGIMVGTRFVPRDDIENMEDYPIHHYVYNKDVLMTKIVGEAAKNEIVGKIKDVIANGLEFKQGE